MKCKQKCTQLLGNVVFPFLLGGMWLLWLQPSSHFGPWGYVSPTTSRRLTVSWKDAGSWQFCGATMLVLGCLSSRFILHKRRHTFLSPLSQRNFLLLFLQLNLILMDTGLFSVIIYLMWELLTHLWETRKKWSHCGGESRVILVLVSCLFMSIPAMSHGPNSEHSS